MKFTKIFLIISVWICPSLFGVAQDQMLESDNSQKIFESLPEAQQAKKTLDSLAKIWQDEMEKMALDLQVRYEDYRAKQGTMNDAAKKEKEQELMKLRGRIQEYRIKKFGLTGELAAEQERILKPIQQKVRRILKEQNNINSH